MNTLFRGHHCHHQCEHGIITKDIVCGYCILSCAIYVNATEMQEPYIPISARPLVGPKSWPVTPTIAKHTTCLIMCTAYQHSCNAVSVHNDKSTCIFGGNHQGNWTQTLWWSETSKNEWTSYALVSGNIYEYQITSTHAIMIHYIFGYSKCMPLRKSKDYVYGI